MRNALFAMLLAAVAAPAYGAEIFAAPGIAVSQDPLMRQIRRKVLQPDGGCSAWTSVADEKGGRISIRLTVIDEAAVLGGLRPERGLLSAQSSAPGADKRPFKKAPAQLKHLDEKPRAWGR